MIEVLFLFFSRFDGVHRKTNLHSKCIWCETTVSTWYVTQRSRIQRSRIQRSRVNRSRIHQQQYLGSVTPINAVIINSLSLRILVPQALLSQQLVASRLRTWLRSWHASSPTLSIHLLSSDIDGNFAVSLKLLDSVVQRRTSQTNTIFINEPITITQSKIWNRQS